MNTLTVDQSGKGHYCSIQEALDAVPYAEQAMIIIEQGVYHEKLFCDKRNVHLVGRGEVVISNSDGAKEKIDVLPKRGTFRSYTAFFSGEFLRMEHVTIQNNAGAGSEAGQGVALYLDVDCSYLTDVRLLGCQDTLFVAPLPEREREANGFYGPRCFAKRKLNTLFFDQGYIQGDVDFIFGGADALFRHTEICSSATGFVTAPSTCKKDIGLVFDHCTFTAKESVPPESVYLMRPWREEGKAAFLSCTLGDHINKKLRIDWPGHEGLGEGTLSCHQCHYTDQGRTDKAFELSSIQAISLLDAIEQRCKVFHQSLYGDV
ncbi:pectinesterase family protein [Sphaerochaeta globosa]|uniref:Pectinesterase n=1 Tax=Sphaerochaeta globosa (strain ATCC BAA-1886 / DSM 22777 / Buddy) TaxID=158189 RepID=F0RVB9_SPHGB|nr:pectinesterase family protein [Sphaerochaeta globosa]ADY12911.1 Pectinesterase [Sphaerochaeta globosa str. Buddy]